jgi:acyl-CoA thioesterase-1
VQRTGLVSILSAIVLALTVAAPIGCKSTPATASVSEPSTSSLNGSNPSPAQTPAPASAPQNAGPTIVCFGDSLTAGLGTDPGQSYPDALQKLLTAGHYTYNVINEGVSGNTTKDGVERLPSVLAHHPRIVVLEFGGNDGLRGLPLEQTQQNIATMIEQLQHSGATVVLAGITLPPSYGPDYITKFNAVYPALAKRYHLRMIPFLLQNVYGVPGDMQADDTHATARGNQQVARNVEKLIQPLLKR